MHNFQRIWVHVYVATLTMNSALKTTLLGFRECQDQNIAINPVQWESGLPEFLFYDSPAQYSQYYQDITFFRNIYNVGFAAAIILFVYVVIHLFFVFKKKSIRQEDETKNCLKIFYRHMKITFYERPLFYFNSVIFYQYFTVMLACCFQFIDLFTNTTGYKAFAGVNAAACIIAFVLATLYPLLFHLYLLWKRRDLYIYLKDIMDKDAKTPEELSRLVLQLKSNNNVFNNRYSEIFYRFLPFNLWEARISLIDIINEGEFFYNLFRFGELWWYAFVVCLMHKTPFIQAFLLMITNLVHILFLLVFKLSNTNMFKYLKILELLFFLGLEILLMVMVSLYETLLAESYRTLGIVGIIFIFIIVALSIVRTFYTFSEIWK